MSQSYRVLNALPATTFRNPSAFTTSFDRESYGREQYQTGLEYGRKARYIAISCNSTWGAMMQDGGHVSSYEGIGYHANTADLLRGFLDSGAPIRVYRFSNESYTIISGGQSALNRRHNHKNLNDGIYLQLPLLFCDP